jgi:hypothetical protein
MSKFNGLLYRWKFDKNDKVTHFYIFVKYKNFFTNIIAYEILQGPHELFYANGNLYRNFLGGKWWCHMLHVFSV